MSKTTKITAQKNTNSFNNIGLSFARGTFVAAFLGLSVLGLVGCSSGSDSAPEEPPVVVKPEDANGLFTGTGTVNDGTTLTDVRGFSYEGRFIFFDVTESVLYDGKVTDITGSDVKATVDVYKDGIKVTSSAVTATGTVKSQSSISVTLNGTGYAGGTLSLTFDPLYNRGATIAKLFAKTPEEWVGGASTDSDATLINSTNDEKITGGTAGGKTGCFYGGLKSIPDADVNIYNLTLNVEDLTSCDHIGTGYSGFFAVVDGASADDTVLFAMSNGINANFSIMVRNIR